MHRVFAKQRRHGSAKASWRRGIAEQSLKGGGEGKPQPFEGKKPQKFHTKKKNGRSRGERGGERRGSPTRPLSSLKLVGTNFQIIKPSHYFFPLNPKAQVSITNFALSANGTVSYSSSGLQQE